jgi:hypothetical protein
MEETLVSISHSCRGTRLVDSQDSGTYNGDKKL